MIAALVLAFVPAASPCVAVDGFDDLKKQLVDQEERERRKAVQGLAQLGTVEAWLLVLDALADGEPMVADEAQLALGNVTDTVLLEALLGKKGAASRKAPVALRAAEALGRLELEVDAKPLAKLLKAKDPEIRRALLWSVERLVLAGKLTGELPKSVRPALQKAVRGDKDAGVRAAALGAEAALLGSDILPSLSKHLADDEPLVRAAAVTALLDYGGHGAFEGIANAADDEHVSVRTIAAESLAALGTKAGASRLVERLAVESEDRLAWRIVAMLQSLSDRQTKRNPAAWKAWADGLAEGWSGSTEDSEEKEPDVGEQSVAFVGLPILSKRVTFLVDFSGSLWEEKGGKTRKAALDPELRRALESLPKDAKFNVIPYTNEPHPWEKSLVPATKANVKKALADFEKAKHQGKGAFWEAALLALEDPEVDTLVVLTDGAPSGGARWNMRLIAELFTEKNRYRRIAVDALLVDTSRTLTGYWKTLCGRSGGRCVSVDF